MFWNTLRTLGTHWELAGNTVEHKKTSGVSHCGLAIYIKKYLKAKEELCKLKYFTMQKNILIFKKTSKRNQNPSRYYNSIITNLKFQHKQKYHVSKNPHIIKIDILLFIT
jgi:hypothetical protein